MPKILITVSGAEKKLSNTLSDSIAEANGVKYTHLKQSLSRIRMVISNTSNLPEEDKMIAISNALITERNIANFIADRYAELNQDDISLASMEIANEIDELFK